jgi:hypothetical protein
MKNVPLTNGKYALVSDCDYEAVMQFKWCWSNNGRKTDYALRTKDGIRMHRFIMQTPREQQVDHINGNGLDNRRENLKNCSHSENQRNRGANNNNCLGIKGVVKKYHRYQAFINIKRKQYYLGTYKTIGQAQLAYAIGKLMLW